MDPEAPTDMPSFSPWCHGAFGVPCHSVDTDVDLLCPGCEAHQALQKELEKRTQERDEARERADDYARVNGEERDRTAEASREAASLREEVARLRDHALTLDGQLHEEAEARAAAERRAEEARAVVQRIYDGCRRGVESSTRLAATLRGVLLAASRDAEAALGILATHPPQQQTPAPADDAAGLYSDTRCRFADCNGDCEGCLAAEVNTLRSRVRELEGRLARVGSAGAGAAQRLIDARADLGLAANIAALPSQQQPAARVECPGCHRAWTAPSTPDCACDPSRYVWTLSTPEGEPGYDLPPDAPEIPEGEPTDDDADPSRWRERDVVMRLGPVEWRIERVTSTEVQIGNCLYGAPIWRTHEQLRADGFRRIRRASTEERRG